jgi:hypothetical protein
VNLEIGHGTAQRRSRPFFCKPGVMWCNTSASHSCYTTTAGALGAPAPRHRGLAAASKKRGIRKENVGYEYIRYQHEKSKSLL